MDKIKPIKILLIDDNRAIHEDFRKILGTDAQQNDIEQVEEELFGEKGKQHTNRPYIIDSAYQGQEAVELIQQAYLNGEPYALAFVDVRMPPGWDGIVTVQHIWEVDPEIQIVICTAYADYSWKEIIKKLEFSSNYLILKKPFDVIEIRQLVASLTTKWQLLQQVHAQINNLQDRVRERTADLEKTLSLTQATLESTPEGIIAIGRDQHIIMHNNVFLELWNLKGPLIAEKSSTLFQRLAKQVEESNIFLKTITTIATHPEKPIEETKEWRLISGKILELSAEPQYLHDQIIGMVLCFRDISDRKKLEEQLLFQATHDSLTTLPNRILLADRMQQALAYAKRDGTLVGVLVFDLDNFKDINDSLGHGPGDMLLKLVAERMIHSVRDIDTVVRLGGDEFVVILVSQKNKEETILKAKEMLNALMSPYEINENSLAITTSIGISFFPEDGVEINSLLKNADAALYRAKDLGRNTFQVYAPEFNEQLLQRAELLTALRKALENEELILYYQPLIKSDAGTIIGFEALIRWRHPKLGLVLPQIFIPLAEESGLIVSIGEWVLKTACHQIKEWQQTIRPDLSIAVNISGYQFIQNDFVEIVKKTLSETKVEPSTLELEMTESHIFRNVPETVDKMKQLKTLGVRLSIDDFGTGYASFSYLKFFPFDKVKIDKTFIKGIHLDKNDDAIVEAIINMTKKMGMEVLAEGVEKPEQIAFLMSHHGSQMQGYYYSPPLDVEKCTELLLKENKSEKIV